MRNVSPRHLATLLIALALLVGTVIDVRPSFADYSGPTAYSGSFGHPGVDCNDFQRFNSGTVGVDNVPLSEFGGRPMCSFTIVPEASFGLIGLWQTVNRPFTRSLGMQVAMQPAYPVQADLVGCQSVPGRFPCWTWSYYYHSNPGGWFLGLFTCPDFNNGNCNSLWTAPAPFDHSPIYLQVQDYNNVSYFLWSGDGQDWHTAVTESDNTLGIFPNYVGWGGYCPASAVSLPCEIDAFYWASQ